MKIRRHSLFYVPIELFAYTPHPVIHVNAWHRYCSVDFWCYFFGLYVIQKGGANLMVMASAISLPLQQLVLCTPFLMAKCVLLHLNEKLFQ